MKNILFSISDPLIERNLLKTDFLTLLSRSDFTCIYLICSNKIFYQYLVEKYESEKIKIYYAPYKISKISALFTYLFRNSIHTSTVKEHQYNQWKGINGKQKIPLAIFILFRIFWYLGQYKLWRGLLRFLYRMIDSSGYSRHLLTKLKPDLVFVPSINPSDYKLAQEAKKEGIFLVQMIRSWDNLTSKTFISTIPDYLIVHNEITRNEAVKMCDVPIKKVFISGIPQFDYLLKNKDRLIQNRDDFYRGLGIHPYKRIVLFSASGDAISPHEKDFLFMIDAAIEHGEIPSNVHVHVRQHPKNDSDLKGVENLRNVTIERPFTYLTSGSNNWLFEERDMVHWFNSLYHSSAVINMASTMSIDAAIFDKPIICLAFDGYHKLPKEKSAKRYYLRDHYKNVVKTGAVDIVENEQELIVAINDALVTPEHKKKERETLVQQQCYKLDGNSSKRIVDFLNMKIYHE